MSLTNLHVLPMGMLKRQVGVFLGLSKEEAALRCQSKNHEQGKNDAARSMKECCSFIECCVKYRSLYDCERKRETGGDA
jgi:hypothetical protein